jgi:hypothetical protein
MSYIVLLTIIAVNEYELYIELLAIITAYQYELYSFVAYRNY